MGSKTHTSPEWARRDGRTPGAFAKSPGCPQEPYLQLPSALRLCRLGPETITGSEISKVLTISCRAKKRWAPGLRTRSRRGRTTCGQWAELYLPVAVTQSYNPLIPDLGVLVNALTFLINSNRLCLKDKSFQRLFNQKR